jgi:sterol desaturase/sphingolipid hydroxylase (fatty acid hydroxylase superfamily)
MIDERTFQLIRSGAFGLVVGLAMTLEWWRPHTAQPARRWPNLCLWGINLVVIGLLCGACVCTAARWASQASIGVFNVRRLPGWITLPAAIISLDLLSYVWHRANHRLAFLWRFHRVHHLDQTPNFSTAVRFHPGELLLSLPFRLAVVVALGIPVEGVIAFEVVFAWANVLEHGNFDVESRLERTIARLFVPPALHRLHHSSERDDLDTNFGTVFSIWDRCFRTYRASASARRFVAGVPGRIGGPAPTVLGLLSEPIYRPASR